MTSGLSFADALSALNLCEFKDAGLVLSETNKTPEIYLNNKESHFYLVGGKLCSQSALSTISDSFTLSAIENKPFRMGDVVPTSSLVKVHFPESTGHLFDVKYSPKTITITKNESMPVTVSVIVNGNKKSIDVVIPVSSVSNTTTKNRHVQERHDLIEKAVRGSHAYLKGVFNSTAENTPVLNKLADRLCKIQAEKDDFMPSDYWTVIDGCRLFGFKRSSDPGHDLDYYALEMPSLALDYGAIYGGYDFSKVTSYGISLYTSSDQIYGLVVIPEDQIDIMTQSPIPVQSLTSSWENLGNGREGSVASPEIIQTIMAGYNACASADGRQGTALKNSDPVAIKDALSSAKKNALNNRLEHEKIRRYYESLGICGKLTKEGLRSTGAILYLHGNILPYRQKDGVGVYLIKSPEGDVKAFVSIYSKD